MLPTNTKSNVYLNEYADDKNKANKLLLGSSIIGELTSTITELVDRGYQPYHLYIISDDEIKDGDWCINKNKDTLYQLTGGTVTEETSKHWDKIIATTDTSLSIITDNFPCKGKYKSPGSCYQEQECKCSYEKLSLPQPSPQFITKYIEEYNKGTVITEVNVDWYSTHETTGDKPLCVKVDLNNCITITKLKDNWNKEEVTKLIRKAFDAARLKDKSIDKVTYSGITGQKRKYTFTADNFINENL